MENKENVKNKENKALIKEKARKSITPSNNNNKKNNQNKDNNTHAKSNNIPFEEVPKRSQVKGLPKKDLKVFESKSSTTPSKNNKNSKDTVTNKSQVKTVSKKRTVSLSKCNGTEFLNSQYDNSKKKQQDKIDLSKDDKTKTNKTSTKSIVPNDKDSSKNINKSKTSDISKKENVKKVVIKDEQNNLNNNRKSNNQQSATSTKINDNGSSKKQTIKKTTHPKNNKKDANRPLSREKGRPTERKPKQKASQNVPLISKNKTNTKNLNKDNVNNNIIINKNVDTKKEKSKETNDESYLIKIRSFIENNKNHDARDELDTKRNRARELSKKQLENNKNRNIFHQSFSFKLFNMFSKIPIRIKLIYLLIITIILIVFFTINYVLKENDFFPENEKLAALENSLQLEEKINEFVSSSDIELTNEIIAPIEANNSVINFNDIKNSDNYIKINIERGLSATQIATLFQEKGVCDRDEFLNFVVSNDLASNLRSGEYYIEKNSSVEEIVNSIIEADPSIIIIYPAKTIDQVDQLLTNKGFINRGDFDTACVNLCQDKGFDFVEGWFAPATYKITNEFDVNVLASLMLDSTMEILSPHVKTIAQNGFSINDIIIIASLIQGETQDVNQMPIISSVIHNRLKSEMPLGIDATTRYELGDWTSELTVEQLNTITPYNTRRQKGLPPSGICLSSKDAILSAIFPKDTNYLYYIHEKDGRLSLALTYEEHLANIAKRDNN